MKELPILFSTEMVRAILEGRKTETRRIIKPQPDEDCKPREVPFYHELRKHWGKWAIDTPEGETKFIKCRYGEKGDILWVRETFINDYFDDGNPGYKADWNVIVNRYLKEPKWKPAIFMPKKAARIWLLNEGVYAQRLHDITEESAKREGSGSGIETYADGLKIKVRKSYMAGWKAIWYKINGKESWDKNPWLFVVKFKVLSTTGRPENI